RTLTGLASVPTAILIDVACVSAWSSLTHTVLPAATQFAVRAPMILGNGAAHAAKPLASPRLVQRLALSFVTTPAVAENVGTLARLLPLLTLQICSEPKV